MNSNTAARPILTWILIFMQALLGLGALWGGGAFILAPDGRVVENAMNMPKNMLAGTPFASYLLPGILLFTFVGIYPLVVAYSLWKQPLWRWPNWLNPFPAHHWSWAASLAAGAIIIIWISVQVIMVFKQVMLPHYICIGWGIAIIGLTLLQSTRGYYRVSRSHA